MRGKCTSNTNTHTHRIHTHMGYTIAYHCIMHITVYVIATHSED